MRRLRQPKSCRNEAVFAKKFGWVALYVRWNVLSFIMIFLIDRVEGANRLEVNVYESLEDVSQRIDWQDILDPLLTILDEQGKIYVWDDSRQDEVGTDFNYSFKPIGTNLELAGKCKAKFLQSGKSDSFEIGGND